MQNPATDLNPDPGPAVPSQVIDLVRENERMRSALVSIMDYAGTAVMGSWRQHVINMAAQGLRKPK